MRGWPATWGWPGAAALLGLAAAGLLGGVLAPRWDAQAAALRQAQRPPALPRPMPVAAPRPGLPATGSAETRLGALLHLAPRHGVMLERTQQQLGRAGGVQRLQVDMAARGRYGELRAFIAAALLADPGLALDQLALRRASAQADVLDAELQWSLFQPALGGDR